MRTENVLNSLGYFYIVHLSLLFFPLLMYSFIHLFVYSQRLEMIMKRVKTDTPDSSPKVIIYPHLGYCGSIESGQFSEV